METRDLLNKMKWHKNYDFSKVRIWYVSRENENDTDTIFGNEILKIGKYFFKTKNRMIPYHRIKRIEYGKKIVFKV